MIRKRGTRAALLAEIPRWRLMRAGLPARRRRSWIVPAAAPGVAATKATKGQETAFACAVRAHSVQSILGAGRLEAAAEAQRGKDEGKHGRHNRAIKTKR